MSAARPILFSAPMVRALLAGTKTQTRRIVKPVRGWQHDICRPDLMAAPHEVWWHGAETERVGCSQSCPYGVPGDTLWVRETWAGSVEGGIDYCADGHEYGRDDEGKSLIRWRPSIHMPRRFSRLTLTLTDVRVERLQEITHADAIAEGCDWATPQPYGEKWDDDREDPREVGYASPTPENGFARDNYRRLWESINGPGSWDANPWVWVLTFRRASEDPA